MGAPYVKKYGLIGLGILATILSWFLGLDWRYSSIVVGIGILFEGFLVLGISLGVIALLPNI